MLPSHCISGFLKSGIYPYDPIVILRDKLLQLPTGSSFYHSVYHSNSNDESSFSFNNSSSNCRSMTRSTSYPNISLHGKNMIRTFALLVVTFFRTKFIKEQHIANTTKFTYGYGFYNCSIVFKYVINKLLEYVILFFIC